MITESPDDPRQHLLRSLVQSLQRDGWVLARGEARLLDEAGNFIEIVREPRRVASIMQGAISHNQTELF